MPKKLNKVCVICGDRASGFNFNTITCESCKAFFRRNAPKEQLFRCLKGGVCDIDLSTRKNCKKCRLNKCFERGMKTELILTDRQKEMRNIKIQGNRETKLIDKSIKLSDNSEDNNISTESGLEIVQFDLNNSNNDLIEIKSQGSNSESDEIPESVYREAVELEFSVLPFERPLSSQQNFNDLEVSRLQELFIAMTALQTPASHSILTIEDFREAIKIMCFKCDQEARKIVKMSKHLKAFKSINETDQIILLKYSVFRIISLRLSEHFDPGSQHWIIITNTEKANLITLDLLKVSKRKYHLDFKNFYKKFVPEWNSDRFIVNLLTAILLFDPRCPRLNQIEPIRFQRNIYMYLLQRYIQIKYQSDSDSITKFLGLLNSLSDLHIIDDKLSKNISEADPERVLPLLWEISNRNN